MTLIAPARELSRPVAAAPTRADVQRRRFTLPSWVVFCMIILTTFALCVTVTMRTHAEKRSAAEKYERISMDVEKLRSTNNEIKSELQRLSVNKRAIETAARTKLNMVRADELVIPIE